MVNDDPLDLVEVSSILGRVPQAGAREVPRGGHGAVGALTGCLLIRALEAALGLPRHPVQLGVLGAVFRKELLRFDHNPYSSCSNERFPPTVTAGSQDEGAAPSNSCWLRLLIPLRVLSARPLLLSLQPCPSPIPATLPAPAPAQDPLQAQGIRSTRPGALVPQLSTPRPPHIPQLQLHMSPWFSFSHWPQFNFKILVMESTSSVLA